MSAETYSKKVADNLINWLRKYGTNHIDSHLADDRRSFPPHVLLDLGNQGFFGMHVEKDYGGLDLKTKDMLRVIEQIAAIDLSLTLIIIEAAQGAHTFTKYASENLKEVYLQQLATGRIFVAGGMTESTAGSNPRAIKSVAIPDKNGWTLRGSKRWVGMANSASIIAVYTQQLDAKNNWVGMSGFLVPRDIEGLHIGPESLTMGLRGLSKNTIYMDNIKIPHEYLLGKPTEGMEIAQDNMMFTRLCLAAASLGAIKRSIQLMVRYAERRTIATGRLVDNPVTLVRLSELTAITDALEVFIYLVANFYDQDPALVPEEAIIVSKILGSEYLGMTVDLLVQTLGARGYEEGSGASQLFRDARVFRIFEGPTEALNMYIGSRILEQNVVLEQFFTQTLNQKDLYNDIKLAVDKVNKFCLSKKAKLFDTPFSVNYWAQSLVGEIITYGLLLGCVEHKLSKSHSRNLQRASLWVHNKYNEAVQKALTFSLAEDILIPSTQLREFISSYTDTIGNIEQKRNTQDASIDNLLKCDQESDPLETHHYEHPNEEFTNEAPVETTFNDQTLVTETERQLLLHEWNNVEKKNAFPDICTHQLFEEQVKLTPDAIAVNWQNKKITYQELNNQANKVAHYLKKEGIKSGKLVGIYVERSIEMIVGLLGILKAGGGYLPLDRSYPEKLLKFMFTDSQADLLLSQQGLPNACSFDAKKIVYLDDVLENKNLKSTNCVSNVNIDSLGYVIYTSGSTGQPKGVMLPHRALSNLISWHIKKIADKRNVLQFTILSFDMSFLEIFGALCSGGTLTLISEQDRMDLLNFAKIIKKYSVQQAVLNVPFLKNLADSKIDAKYFTSLREVIIAGEQLNVSPAILSFFNQLKSCKLLNYYGPSETHVATYYEFPKKTADWPNHPPIGRAIANSKILILDEDKQLVPIGVPGEIYIGGACLGLGYLNRKELTQEKFIKDPWDEEPTSRLYRTGDFGKYLPDGNIVFIGRKDDQVKIRGFRIQLQEIESCLLKYPGIKEAVVIAKNGGLSTDKHLESFIVLEENVSDTFIQDVCCYLRELLPAHMIPAAFNILEKMPLTATGKINRSTLSNYGRFVANTSSKIVQPTTVVEKVIIAIMEDFFKLNIGINDSFSSIGGNSMLAMHIASKLRNKFSIEIPAYVLLSDPTIADTAKRIEALIARDKKKKAAFIEKESQLKNIEMGHDL